MLTGERAPGTRTVWCGRALLLAALLLGLVTMHTLGHLVPERPAMEEHVAAAPAPAPAPAAVDAPGAVADHAMGHHMSSEGHAPAHDNGHGTGTDPLSVCLAVLGVWTAAALLGAAVLLVWRTEPLAPLRDQRLRVLWPLPPPRTALRLAQLSILRI
ncbi:hypothetical protein [Streptomyces sp. 3N207]|uniref:hypothetical protein n=1 Tax=Streptomyces sp. 3N207 TaxID=3457417 RepID=UPI003FD1B3FE